MTERPVLCIPRAAILSSHSITFAGLTSANDIPVSDAQYCHVVYPIRHSRPWLSLSLYSFMSLALSSTYFVSHFYGSLSNGADKRTQTQLKCCFHKTSGILLIWKHFVKYLFKILYKILSVCVICKYWSFRHIYKKLWLQGDNN